MENLLPKFQSFSLSKEDGNSSSQWKPQDAVVTNYLPKVKSQPLSKGSYNYQTNLPPPNERYHKIIHEVNDPSPLSNNERGISEKPKMHLSSTRGIKSEPIQDKIITPISITNGNVLPIQLFYQSTSNILDMPLDPGDNAIRFPNGKLPRDDSNRALFEVFVATAKRLSIVMSLKQHLQSYIFQPTGIIGIEVEMKNNKLICTKIFEGSQAWPYEKELYLSEIVAVNNKRVLSLQEFRAALVTARESGGIVKLLVVAQLGENVILDELITFHKKSRKMARLVSGAFEEASAEDVDSVSSIAHAEIHDDISLEPKVVPGKSKGGVFDPGDEVDSKFERTSDSLKSISLDAEEKATSQANPMADSRRTNTVVETIEYLQEIGNNGEDKESNSSKKSESKIVMPILTEIDDAEDVKSEGCDAEQHSSRNKESCPWNYATALDENDITSHRHLVCVPKSLNSSVGWGSGHAKVCMHLANYSQSWQLDISWVGEDSGLVSRAILNSGDTHVELMSCEHVWCLTVQKKNVPIDVSMHYQIDGAGNFPDDIPDLSATSFLFRPPPTEKSTLFSPAVSIIWIPWHSIAFAECSKQRIHSNYGDETVDLFIKVFDSKVDQKNRKGYKK